MTYIPDTSQKMIKHPYSVKEEENAYYEGLVNEKDKEYLNGIDYAIETAKNFFNNLDIYQEIEDVFNKLGYEFKWEDTDFIVNLQSIDDMTGEEIEKEMEENPVRLLLRCLCEGIQDWMFGEKNMMTVSMIDNMDEDEYQQKYKEVFGHEQKE